MKKIQSILLVLICATAFSQQRGMRKIEWIEKKAISFGSYSIIAPSFKSKNFQLDGEKKEVLFTLNLPISFIALEESIQITDQIFETITTDQLGDLATERIPNQINPKLINNVARNNNNAFISLSPIIKEGNTYKRLVSFTYSFSKSQNQAALSERTVSEIQNSILSTGDWYRFYVEKSGVYKISKNFLNQLGLNTASDPRKIKIFGNGGRMLPLANQTYYPDDLIENAIQIVGENDGVFDSDDYVLFYAEGIDSWSDENQTHLNLYDTKSYYYVTINGANGKRTSEMLQPVDANPIPITSFTDYQFHEKDLTNVVRTGRRWTGEPFNIDNEQSFDFTFPNIITTSPIELFVSAASAAFTSTAFEIQVNNQLAGSINFSALSTSSGTELTFNSLNQNSILSSSANVSVKLKYNNNGVPSSKAYLDFIVIKAKRMLSGYGKQFRFQYDAAATTAGVGEFQFTNASGIKQIWDITDPYNCSYNSNENQSNFAFKADLGESRKYIALDPNDFYYPLKEAQTKVTNQNIKGTIFKNDLGQFQDIDYLIITPLFLNSQAEKLANFHRNYSQLNVKVVNLESIYPEFSSGKQDVAAIRNLVKYVYKNASTPEKRVRYVNLFGDASFDFKDRIPNNTNVVPIFHSINSTSAGESSFASDDFFGLMDDSEGNVTSYFGGIDIAVGRMLVNTPEQAEQMITKVLEYHDIKSYGNWRNNCVFISDDSDKASDASLQFRQNQLSDVLFAEKPFLNIKKILLDSYVQETSSGGNRYPKAREDLFNAFEKGALVFNYLGHGGEDGLSGERIWEKIDGQNLINQYKYPLFITITCDFSRFDNPYRPTAGEYTYWNPKGGAISMITTIRSIGQYSAEFFNDQLSSHLFSYGSNEYPSMAEALRLAKNSNPNSSSNVVFYIGDPAIMLAIAKPKIRLTKVNDAPITGPIDDLQSLAYVKISGEVTDENNTPLTGYSGALSVTVFDKFVNKTTINNDGNSPPIPFSALGETIFRGNASVTNGAFEFGFMVPRDIRIPVGNGRISFYSKRNQLLLDKSGYDSTIKIGGINPNATADNVGPKAQLYMNDQSFIYGGITNESPLLLAFLEDENGINTASGIGHDIVAILDGDESNPYVLNDYYETELDNYKKGKLQFPFRNLSVGLHSITLKAWDVYNNPITAEIQFIVVGDETITLTNVLNYPNPFVNYTQFWFTHNRPFEPLEVQVQVLTITGKIVWTKNQTVTTDGFLSREISWDGKDDFGDKIGKGVYIYKLTVKSTLTNTKTEKYEKLVIL